MVNITFPDAIILQKAMDGFGPHDADLISAALKPLRGAGPTRPEATYFPPELELTDLEKGYMIGLGAMIIKSVIRG